MNKELIRKKYKRVASYLRIEAHFLAKESLNLEKIKEIQHQCVI